MACLQLNDNAGSMPWERAEHFAGLIVWQHGVSLGHFVKMWRLGLISLPLLEDGSFVLCFQGSNACQEAFPQHVMW